ncbi:MAG: Lar family restriction alleviation protein [Oscillospiraceae bacterium]|nr:Lar family restriction alleviation protein [Oscillospiraceae bacterium]
MEMEYAGKKVNLLPCPFCGGDPAIHSYRRLGSWYRIHCAGDGCLMVPVTYNYRDLEQAVAAWNQRPGKEATS